MKFLIRFLIIPFFLCSFILFFPSTGVVETFLEKKDIYLYPNQYKKKIVEVDSLYYSFIDDMDNGTYYGYSKVLDNYKTTIYFGDDVTGYEDRSWYEKSKVKNDSLSNGEYNDTKFHCIWYRNGYNKAFPATNEEKTFPVKSRLFDELRLFIIWLISTVCTIILWKIGVKMGFMKNENKNEE